MSQDRSTSGPPKLLALSTGLRGLYSSEDGQILQRNPGQTFTGEDFPLGPLREPWEGGCRSRSSIWTLWLKPDNCGWQIADVRCIAGDTILRYTINRCSQTVYCTQGHAPETLASAIALTEYHPRTSTWILVLLYLPNENWSFHYFLNLCVLLFNDSERGIVVYCYYSEGKHAVKFYSELELLSAA
ncbi:hypothetical protein ANN_01272 [Periplaneta americana]|uniref:Uncharacterized protein n=1 Tax=Periplaneta americana TaxID=6978 RepID=A0ABQ8TVI9_PERAM|nr:hypothetical protein ANN_01272 [Periplaneta americana]